MEISAENEGGAWEEDGRGGIRMELVEEGRHARLRLLEGRQLCSRGLQRHGALTERAGVCKRGRSATDYAADCAAAGGGLLS
jgi:hypothetical protein